MATTPPLMKDKTQRPKRTMLREDTNSLECGTGTLAIFLRKSFQLDVTTSDCDDQEIADNIDHNCRVNGITFVLTHVEHVKEYENLIKTLSFLLKSYKPKVNEAVTHCDNEHNDTCDRLPRPAFLMSWRRRIGKEDESLFFTGCENAGLDIEHLGSCVFLYKA